MRSDPTAYLILILLAGNAWAEGQPLSVIDWVKRHPEQPPMTSAMVPDRFEPPVTPGVSVPDVEVRPLGEETPRLVGLVPSGVTGLPESLWAGSTIDALEAQISDLPILGLPAAQALLYTLLLTEAAPPGGDAAAGDRLTVARAATLVRFGAHEPAISLLEAAGRSRDRGHFAAYMDATLLTGEEDAACAILDAQPHLAPSLAHRIFCTARQGDWPTAALLFDTGRSLGALGPDEAEVLARFLQIDEEEDEAPPLARPETVTPLLFRLYEAVGEPLPTGSLPRAYAVADLRDLAGWKQQLEAAERLALSGALPANRLLGLYTAREPAASGGIWDRVSAVQRFETALRTRSTEAISKSLPPAWEEMQGAGLGTLFADLFADGLTRYPLEGAAARSASEMLLLSPRYGDAAGREDIPPLLRSIAAGDPGEAPADTPLGTAILESFDPASARGDLLGMARNGRMGEAILRTLLLLENGAAGDPVALRQSLATLRAFGLEDTARRAALQIMLLERPG